MKAATVFILTIFMFSACTKIQRGKSAYKSGKYQKALALLEEALQKDQNNEKAKKFIILARSGLLTETAKTAMGQENFEAGLQQIDEALSLDPENKNAQTLLSESVDKIVKKIEGSLVPNKAWASIVPLSELILKYHPDRKSLFPIHAQATYHLESGALNYRSILALQKATKMTPDDPFVREKGGILTARTKKFENLFQNFQKSLLNQNFSAWKGMLHPRHLSEVNVDVKKLVDDGDEKIKTIKDYFLEIAEDPKKYGNPDGGELVCVEPLSDSHAFVHFQYKDLPKILKMEITPGGGSLKIHREEDSEIKKSDLL